MIKKLKRVGSDGLMVYFTKEEIELYGLIEGDKLHFDDLIFQKEKKKR